MTIQSLTARLQHYYEGMTPEAKTFRYSLLTFDLLTILFIIITSFLPRTIFVEIADAFIGVYMLTDCVARILVARNRLRALIHPMNVLDAVVIISFLAPMVGEGFGFLRILRTLRMMRAFHTIKLLRTDFPYFRRHEEIFIAATHLSVFIFVMTGIVYETQHYTNAGIANYADALYFTVTTLTTTGFGDVILTGTAGRLLAVVIMIAGVTLFLRLAQVLFRPTKVQFDCLTCGLTRHEPDAIHCKHCGASVRIKNEGN